MAAFSGPTALAPTGSTGNNTHTAAGPAAAADKLAVQFIVEAVGVTPTVTFKAQGSLDGTNFFDLLLLPSDSDTAAVSRTVTAVGTYTAYLAQAVARFLSTIRLVTSANTNVTYRGELYAHLKAS